MIEVQGLRKQYGELVAVDGVTFTAEPGRIFGLLGPNGAGKSTIINCLSGLMPPTSGRVRVLGHDVVTEPMAARRQLGVVPQELALYEDLSARDNLAYWGAAYGLAGGELKSRVDEVLGVIGLQDRAKEPVKRYSSGMKRRLNFGCGIVHRPKALLLDEPTVGVDPQSRVRLLDLVREQVAAGTGVLYTTHYMEEAQDLCHTIAIIDHGKVLAIGTLADLRALLEEHDLVRVRGKFDPARVRQVLSAVDGIEVVSADADLVVVAAQEASRKVSAILAAVAQAGEIQETSLSEPSLETLFIKMTGRQLRE